jgi:hypothetical protein
MRIAGYGGREKQLRTDAFKRRSNYKSIERRAPVLSLAVVITSNGAIGSSIRVIAALQLRIFALGVYGFR